MRQLSLFDLPNLARVLPSVRAAMRGVAAKADGDGRKLLVDKINSIAKREDMPITGNTGKGISKEILDKWLSNDATHPPGIKAILVFCEATGDATPLRELLRPFGLDIMTAQDRRWRDIAKADEEIKALKKRKKLLEGGV